MHTIRFATYLAPNIYETYAYIARYVEEKVGQPTTLAVGQSFNEIADGRVDVAFMCGLPYATMAESPTCPFELLAAPVLHGERYQHRPIYFSDVIVRKDSPYTSFDDLRGCAWAYNQRESHSGWNIVVYSLLQQGQTPDFFGQLIESGSHLRSIAMLGPSSIPPVVIAKAVDQTLKRKLQAALLAMHEDPQAASALRAGAIERFVQVCDEGYQDIRKMRDRSLT